MALSILDGTQTATTLSTILSSGQHITAHTVVSLGTQAITDILNATSAGLTNTQLRSSAVTISGTVTVGNFPATQPVSIASVTVGNTVTIAGTVTANPTGTQTIAGSVTIGAGISQIGSVTASISNSVTIGSLPAISGTVTANVEGMEFSSSLGAKVIYSIPAFTNQYANLVEVSTNDPLPISGTVTIGSALPAGTNRIGVVTIGAGTVTIGAGTAQIGSVTASISGTVPVSGTFFQATQPVSLTTLPALVAGTAQIGSVTVGNSVTIGSLPAISGTVTANVFGLGQVTELPALIPVMNFADPIEDSSIANIVPIQITNQNGTVDGNNPLPISGTVTASLAISSTAITSGSFSSLTSATLVPGNTARKMATVYNLGAGQLFVNARATATTLGGGFMVAISSGGFFQCDFTTTTLSAIFATAGTASWMSH